MSLIHFVDHNSTGHGLCGAGRITDSYTSSPGWVSCLVCRAKLIDQKKERELAQAHMHYAKDAFDACAKQPVCEPDNFIPARITTAKQIVSCPDCKAWIRSKAQEKDVTKDALQEARELRELANTMLARAADIERKEKLEHPEEPPVSAGSVFKLIVRFRGNSKLYTYLLYRKPSGSRGGPWYTTGTGDTGYFENWDALIAWLRSDNVSGHGKLTRLVEAEARPGTLDPKVRYHLGGKTT